MGRKKDLPYKTDGDIFATRLRKVMEERGENQTTLAEKVGVQRQSISQYMNGITKPDTIKLAAISNALDVSSDFLIGLSETKCASAELRAVCDYTGLSEEAVFMLCVAKQCGISHVFEKAIKQTTELITEIKGG